MTEDEKRRADILLGLMKQAWANAHGRRSYEWKLSLGMWSALVLFTSGILTAKRECLDGLDRDGVLVSTIAVCAIIAWVHYCWLTRALPRQDCDRKEALNLEKKLCVLAGHEFPEGKLTLDNAWWSMGPQLAITLVLCLAAILSLIAKL